MTREEAINTLANFKRYISGGGVIDAKANEALDMAIEALSEETSTIQEKHQLSEKTPTDRPTKPTNIPTEPTTEARKREPSDDLISRAEAAEIFEAMLKTVTDQKIKIGISRLWQQIKDLPSADRPRGEWIDRSDGIEGAWNYCSVCGELAIDLYDFCPNCGADMRSE